MRDKIIFVMIIIIVLGAAVFLLPAMTRQYQDVNDLNATLEGMVGVSETRLAGLKQTLTVVEATYEARQNPTATATPDVRDSYVADCETWRFENNVRDNVLIESNSDMAALSLHFMMSAQAARLCAEIDSSFMEDADLYLLNALDTLTILNSWLIHEESE